MFVFDKKMYKILQVIDRLDAGGAERVFLDMTQLLLDKDIEVDTLTISGKGVLYNTIDQRAKHFFLDRRMKFSINKMLECAKLCANYDIVHVHMRHTYSYVKLAQILFGKKYKIIFHDHYGDIDKNILVPWTLRFFFKPSHYIGVSSSLCTWAKCNLKMNSLKIWMLRNTIIPYENKSVVPKNNKWVIVSNIRPSKNIEFAIQFASANHKVLDIFGQFTGDQYSKKILELVCKTDQVKLFTNELNVQSKMQAYHMAIHVAHSESGPLVLMEYLIQGLPFLAHKAGEVADVLKNELPECFVDSLNIEEWNLKLQVLNDNLPSERKLRDLFFKFFSPEQYINQCIAIYQEVLNS
jgi:glycosyltransferase involved in cell wall biosynthesis